MSECDMQSFGIIIIFIFMVLLFEVDKSLPPNTVVTYVFATDPYVALCCHECIVI